MSTGASARAKSTGKAAHERSADFARHYSLQLREGGVWRERQLVQLHQDKAGGERRELLVRVLQYVCRHVCVFSEEVGVGGAAPRPMPPQRPGQTTKDLRSIIRSCASKAGAMASAAAADSAAAAVLVCALLCAPWHGPVQLPSPGANGALLDVGCPSLPDRDLAPATSCGMRSLKA